MTDHIRDLDEVVRLAGLATPGPWLYRIKSNSWYRAAPDGSPSSYGEYIFTMGLDGVAPKNWRDEEFIIKAAEFMTKHHAAIRRDAEDAAFGRAMREAMEAEYQAAKESRKDGKQEAWITTYCLLRRLKVAADHLSDAAIAKENERG